MLNKKLVRDLRRSPWQTGAAILVLTLGVAMFDASYDSYRDLRESYHHTQVETRAAHDTFEFTHVDPEIVGALRRISGVAAVVSQAVADVPVRVGERSSGMSHLVLGRLIGIPLGQQPGVDRVVVAKGRYPSSAHEVIIEQHFADYFHLGIADTLSAAGQSLRVVGIGESAQYLWVARSRQDPMPSPSDFGVLFVANDTVKSLAGLEADNRVAVFLAPDAPRDVVLATARHAIGSSPVIAETPLEKMPGIELLQFDIDGLRMMAIAFPLLFLAVATFITAALIARKVEAERVTIGTFLAIGMRPARILRHYLGFGAIIAVTGAGAGTVLGHFLGIAMTRSYAQELHIPFVTATVHPGVISVGGLVALILPLLACFVPARHAAALAPVEAMRPVPPQVVPTGWFSRGQRLPLWLRVSLREIGRQPARNLGTVAGIVSALLLIIITSGMLDSMQRGMDLTTQSLAYDLRVDLAEPLPRTELQTMAFALPGVQHAQSSLTLPVLLTNENLGKSYETMVQEASHSMLRTLNASGAEIAPTSLGIIVTRSIASKLHMTIGETLSARILPNGPTLHLQLQGVSDSMMGNTSVVLPSDLRGALGANDLATTAFLAVDPRRADGVREALEQMPRVAHVTATHDLRESLGQMMGLSVLLLAVMLFFAVVLAGAILFNTTTIGIFERQRELTTLRTIGFRMSAIVRMVTAQNVILGMAGMVIGLPISLLALDGFLHLFSSDLFSLPLWIYPRTIIVAVLSIFAVLLVAEWPALRHIARLNLAEATKARE